MRENVYFITYKNGPVKIGKAKNVSHRLSQLQVSHPSKLEVLGVMVGPNGLECALHQRFKQYHINGEWFERTALLDDFISDNSVDFWSRKKEMELAKKHEDQLKKREIKNRQTVSKIRYEILASLKEEFETAMSNAAMRFCDGAHGLYRLHLRLVSNHATYGDINRSEKEIREILQKILEINWQTARSILTEQNMNSSHVNYYVNHVVDHYFKSLNGMRSGDDKYLDKLMDKITDGGK